MFFRNVNELLLYYTASLPRIKMDLKGIYFEDGSGSCPMADCDTGYRILLFKPTTKLSDRHYLTLPLISLFLMSCNALMIVIDWLNSL
jgi:hypothetical protein